MKANINILESVGIALDSLRSHKLRSFLTLLGNIIGVMTVITVVTIIQGLNRYVKYQLFTYGSNTFYVRRIPEITTSLKMYQEMNKRKKIRYEDYLFLKENAKLPERVEAQYDTMTTTKYGNRLLQETGLSGVTMNNHLTGRTVELESGRFLAMEDERLGRQVCVIGYDLKKELFPFRSPLGEWIGLGDQKYRVIGICKPMGKIIGFSLDNFAQIPITTFQKHYSVQERDILINIKAGSVESMRDAKEEVRTLMRSHRKLTFLQEDDFSIEDSQTFIDFYNNLTGVLFIAMVAIASISMVVGGIVIMNIMLVSVTERIQEIGLRKALGARRRDILMQFLIESSSISAVGGILGIIIGFIIAKFISIATSLPARLEPWSVLLAIAMASSVGLFFGIYPANKAARLDPVVALRLAE